MKRALRRWLDIDGQSGDLQELKRDLKYKEGQIDALCVIVAEILGSQNLENAKRSQKLLEALQSHLAARYEPDGEPSGSAIEAGAENARNLVAGILSNCVEYRQRN